MGVMSGVYSTVIFPVPYLPYEKSLPPKVSFSSLFDFFLDLDLDRLFLVPLRLTDLDLLFDCLRSFVDLLRDFLAERLDADLFSNLEWSRVGELNFATRYNTVYALGNKIFSIAGNQ